MKILTQLLVGVSALLAVSSLSAAGEHSKENAIEKRREYVQSVLPKQKDTVMLLTKGLTCPSCAIGIRKKTSQLDFVDRSRFNKGISLDVERQLVSVALQPGAKYSAQALADAIWDAGYDPVALFAYVDGAVQVEALAKK